MTLTDLLFLASFLVCLVLTVRLVWLAVRGKWMPFRRTFIGLAAFVGLYGTALIVTALSMPRRELSAGERKCFDDWCVTASTVELQPEPSLCAGAQSVWVTTVEVASVARRVEQRAADASLEVEDTSGKRYLPCNGSKGSRSLRDLLRPGESIAVSLPFAMPTGTRPVGVVIHHGAFPGLIIIGGDQSWLHNPTLMHAVVR